MLPTPFYTRLSTLSSGPLREVPKKLFGRTLSPQAMRRLTSSDMFAEIAADKPRITGIIEAVVQEPLAILATQPAATHARHAFLLPSLPVGEGHIIAVVGAAPMSAALAQDMVTTHNAMRYVVTSFPSGGASYSRQQHEDTLATGKLRIPRNVPRPLASDVVARNVKLFEANAPIDGLHLLGGNSWCTAKMHVSSASEELQWQSVAWVTTRLHSQDGVVFWHLIRHPRYPAGVLWLSIHYGNHQLPLGDTINAAMPPYLFHPTFQRAADIAALYPDLRKTMGAQSAALMLNPDFAERIERWERTHCPARKRQMSVMSFLDRTAGLAATSARYAFGARAPAAT